MANEDPRTASSPSRPADADNPPHSDWARGALCAEAQADGVPCTELGRKCETCEQAVHAAEPSAW